jgi:hypothetical protein
MSRHVPSRATRALDMPFFFVLRRQPEVRSSLLLSSQCQSPSVEDLLCSLLVGLPLVLARDVDKRVHLRQPSLPLVEPSHPILRSGRPKEQASDRATEKTHAS